MKTFKYIISILALVIIVALSLLALDYKEKWETVNSQHESLLKSQNETQKLVEAEKLKRKEFQDYSKLVKDSYDKLLQNYNYLQAQVETLKSKKPEVIVKTIKSKPVVVKIPDNNIDKVLSLLDQNKSQIETLKGQLASVQNSCSQPIVKIVERPTLRQPASKAFIKSKKKQSQKKPVDRFN